MTLSVTKTTNNWTDGGVLSGWQIHRYVVSADDNETYGYSDLFTVLGSHADFTYTAPTPDNADNTNPTRTFTVGWVPTGNEAAIIFLEFNLAHEFTESTAVSWPNNVWCGLMNSEPTSIDITGSTLDDWSITWPTGKSGSHVIRQGYVDWRFPGSMGGVSQCRAVDLGEPTKNASATRIQSSLGMIGPAEGQLFEALNGRLRVTTTAGSQRQDFDFVGNGQINVDVCTLMSDGNGLGWMHYANSHPDTSVNWRYAKHDGGSFNPGQARGDGGITADPEVFSTFPTQSTHQYLNKTVRQSSAYSALRIGDELSAGWQKYLPSFVGANRDPDGAQSGIVIQGVPGSAYGYAQQLTGNNDWIFLDPSWRMTSSTDTPANWTASNGRAYDAIVMRANSVVNRNAAGVAKSSRGYVIGRQTSATNRVQRNSGTASIVPVIRPSSAGGTWTVREINTSNGRGVHYLHDCTKHQATDGQSANNWTRYDDSDNESWILHRGGLTRYSQDVSLRSTPWDSTSLGSTGRVTNNDVNDIPCLSDNFINLWAPGVDGEDGIECTNTVAITSSTTAVTLSGFTNITTDEVANFTGGIVTLGGSFSNPRTITGATRVSDSEVTVNFASGGAAFAANSSLHVRQHAYEWVIDTTDNGTFDFEVTADKSLTYTGLAACIQAKLERLADCKLDELGNENFAFNNTRDAYWAGGASAVSLNLIIASMLPSSGDGSYIQINTARANSLSLLRMGVLSAGSNSLTLNPDVHTHLNFGSTFTVDSSVTFAGAFTDSNGTPSFITLNIPDGVDVSSDLNVSVGVRTAERFDSDAPTNALSFTGQSHSILLTLGPNNWNAVRYDTVGQNPQSQFTLPTSWNWTTAGFPRPAMVFGNSNTNTITTIRNWANNANILNKYVRFDTGTHPNFTNYAVFRVVEVTPLAPANFRTTMILEGPVISQGSPQASMRITFGVDSSGNNVVPYNEAENHITAHPTIQSSGSERFVRVEASEGPSATNNNNDEWYVAVTGSKTLDFRGTYTGAVSETETLSLDPLAPSGTSSSSGSLSFVPYRAGPTATGAAVTVDSDAYPYTYIHDTTRLGMQFSSYDNMGTATNITLDYLAAKVSDRYSDFVCAYGTNGGQANANTTAGIEVTNAVYRIVVPQTSRAEFLFMDGNLPVKTQFYVDLSANQDVFFGAPTYDPSLVRIEMQNVIDPISDRLAANQVRLSRGIPPRGTVSE